MKECFLTELKTLLHSKYIYIGLLLLIFLSSFYNYSSCNNAIENVKYDVNIYEEMLMLNDDTIDTSTLDAEVIDIYKTYHPSMVFNLSLSMLIGIGLIVLPILSSLFWGNDYGKSNMIKCKICYYSLIKVFIAKLCCIILLIITAMFLYLTISIVILHSIWSDFEIILKKLPTDLPILTINIISVIKVFVLTFVILLFYSLTCACIAALFKTPVSGIVFTVVINYVVLPFKYSPHNVIYALINNNFTFTSASPAVFSQNPLQPALSNIQNILLLFTYFIVLLFIFFIISKRQRN